MLSGTINDSLNQGGQMDQQGGGITGNRALAQAEIEAINRIRAVGHEVGQMIESLQGFEGLDQRWVSIGKTQVQLGLMALERGVAQPDTF